MKDGGDAGDETEEEDAGWRGSLPGSSKRWHDLNASNPVALLLLFLDSPRALNNGERQEFCSMSEGVVYMAGIAHINKSS
jgi:hypothetical protein